MAWLLDFFWSPVVNVKRQPMIGGHRPPYKIWLKPNGGR
jgi:hypothetical protein